MRKHLGEWFAEYLLAGAIIIVILITVVAVIEIEKGATARLVVQAEYYRRHGIDITAEEIRAGIQPVMTRPIPAEAPAK